MLQPYEWEIEVKINDRDWEGTNFNGWDLMGKVPETYQVIIDNFSFEDFYNYQLKEALPSFFLDETLFRKRKIIHYRPSWSIESERFLKKDITSISVRFHYRFKEVSLNDILTHCKAEKTIQYLKERGLNNCPFEMEE